MRRRCGARSLAEDVRSDAQVVRSERTSSGRIQTAGKDEGIGKGSEGKVKLSLDWKSGVQ